MEYNILIVGVGGQGTLLASRILGAYAELKGLDCKLSEVHGMSQRGGSVVTHVRIGEKIYSPIIAEGEADVILAFEKLEAYRWKHFLKQEGVIIVNSQEILPMPVIMGAAAYPNNILEDLNSEGKRVISLDALKLAETAGSSRAVNTVMLGVLAKTLTFSISDFYKALELSIKPKLYEINEKAMTLGYNNEK